MLARWERVVGHSLPRPVVLEGELTQPGLGLNSAATEWVGQHCQAVLHSAASLSFQSGDRTAEPWRSNLDGARHVLDFCRTLGIRQFHHVSTAYVCGLRSGRVLESELDIGQTFGNDYEQSKAEAEKLIRAADFLDPPTIYRPAIIVGDSLTGYSTTFHGFYTPLKIVRAFVKKLDASGIDGRPLLALLGFGGQERKNLVPVDWVSAVITYLRGQPQHHGCTYHLVPRRAVPVSLISQVIEQSLRTYIASLPSSSGSGPLDLGVLPVTFREQMEVYRAYWRDDPEFDDARTTAAAPHLPCPDVTASMLLKMAEYALCTDFGWPRPQPIVPRFDVHAYLQSRLPLQHKSDVPQATSLGLQVNGPGGGQWQCLLDKDRPIGLAHGLTTDCATTAYLNSNTFERIATRRLAAAQAINTGQVLVEGSGIALPRLAEALQSLAPPVTEERPLVEYASS